MAMRVVFIGKNHDFSLLPLKAIRSAHKIVAIVESAPRLSETSDVKDVSPLRSDRRSLKPKGFEKIARELEVPYFRLSKATEQDFPRVLNSVFPDILCIASLSQLLKENALLEAKHGAINLHPSLLPRYHGPFPWFWQYHDFVSEWGVTLHFVDIGQDTGPVLNQDSIDIPLGTDITEAMRIAGLAGAKLFIRTLEQIESKTCVPRPQPVHQFPKARVVKTDEQFVDWQSWPIERVWHFMRGTYPWHKPVKYPDLGSRREVTGWKVGSYERSIQQGHPGLILKDHNGYFVTHKEGKIRVAPEMQAGPLSRAFNRLFNSHG